MNYKHLLLICVLGASFTACTLDENPRDQIPEEEAYTKAVRECAGKLKAGA